MCKSALGPCPWPLPLAPALGPCLRPLAPALDCGFGAAQCAVVDVRYTGLTDSVLHHLRAFTTEPDLEPARALLNRVVERDLYAFVDECILGTELKCAGLGQQELARRVKDLVCARTGGAHKVLVPADLEVMFVRIDYGMADRNPVDLVGFFKGAGPGRCIPAERVSRLLPTVFSEL
jgi:hypothetical protein